MKTSVDRARKSVVDAIISNEFPVGTLLPPVSELATRTRCSEATMQNALLNLAWEGVVSRVRKRGTIVERIPKSSRVALVLSFDLHENILLREQVYSRMDLAGFDIDVMYRTTDFPSDLAKLKRLREGLEPVEQLVMLSPDAKLLAEATQLFPKVIAWMFDCPLTDHHAVRVDYQEAARAVAEYLLDLGHTKIGVCAGDFLGDYESFAAETYRTFRHLVEIRGGQCVPHYFARQSVEAFGEEHFGKDITAYWALIDSEAVKAVMLCQKKGLRVPQDISILGRNDTPWCTALTPNLTSLSINPEGVAEAIVNILEGKLPKSRGKFCTLTITPKLVIRDSTGLSAR